MDELEISGRRYISSRRAGKEHGYHADYIGQLIRAKKVIGQKVGRAWYVDAESLATYLGTESAPRPALASVGRVVEKAPAAAPVVEVVHSEPETAQEPEVVEEESSHIPIKISQPLPVEKNIETKEEQPVFYRSVKEEREARTRGGLRYIEDEGPLLPRIQKSAPRSDITATPIPLKIVEKHAEKHVERVEPVYERVEEEVFERPAPVAKRTAPKKNQSSSMALRTGLVLVLGAVVFAIAAFASTHLLFTETISGSQSANAGYSVK